jgi:phage terminase large subunit-like protein
MTRAERNIKWIEDYCVIPEGKDVGKAVVLREWQKDEIRKIYDNPHGTRRAIVSFGKKNAKTTLSAFLLLLHLSGPEAKRNSQLVSTAQSRDQAAVLFELAAKIVRMSPVLSDLIDPRYTVKQLYDKEWGTLYRALSADASTAHGQSPIFAVHDELGQVRGPVSELYNAIENAMGAHEQPMSIVISTQAPTDVDLLSQLIDNALEGKSGPRTVVSLYTAPMDLDPFSVEAMRAANPALGDFLNEDEVKEQAESARQMPALEALYRNYTLNQRVEASAPFVSATVWAANAAMPEDGHIVYGGLDLSETNDLTALVLASPAHGKLSIHSTFWLPEYGLEERARKDRVPYNVWARDGYITTTPGKSIEYESIALYIAELFETKDVRKIAFDRWNMKHLRPWLVRAGMSEALIDDRFVEFGQGYQSMTPALRTLESLLLSSKIRHGMTPVLKMCATNAVVKTDEVGNRKLDKKKSRGRIDGMVALAMAVAMAYEHLNEKRVFSVPAKSFVQRASA